MAQESSPLRGGVLFPKWVVAAPPRGFSARATGQAKTVLELRDPRQLGNSLTIFLDGEVGELASVRPGTEATLLVESVRSGRGRGELIATVERSAVEAALIGGPR